ncbi:FlgO family outer membrane protein [Halomonas saccharevitans]|uniref:FlgO family outer membrane protein n=1 Tax=Halomonas saccharevitans TaxID=416872 RepID=A0ABU3NDH3_9GAMM|nr:FlgO family outer membrane protein [Halomonas saccharevitans]MDT8879235.1 FlgO family outer membrane protein [Halomonas saccharevitans]
MLNPLRRACLLLILLLSLTGCAHHERALYNAPPAPGLDEALGIAMHEMAEAFPELTEQGPMIAASFIDVEGAGASTAFDRIAAELSAAELARAGVPVREVLLDGGQLLVMEVHDGLLTHRVRRQGASVGARTLLLGTYALGHERLFLALRVVELRTDRVLASRGLSLPLDGDLRQLLRSR